MPQFKQSIEIQRPHTLLTVDAQHSGKLHYRYDDTLEEVLVPNIWYNQTYQTRVAAVRYEAQMQDDKAAHTERCAPYGLSPAAVADMARRYRERAARLRAEADRMEAAGLASHPVMASRMNIDLEV